MKNRITAIFISFAIVLSLFSSIQVLGFSKDIKTLEDVISAVENANEADYTTETWNKLQENYSTAKRLSGDQEYFAIRADVPNEPTVLWDSGWPSGHNNYNKYISLVDAPSTQAYLAYKGHGSNDYEKAEFTADQLWEKVVVDEEKGIFMLRNVERDAYLCGMRQDGTWAENAHQYFYVMKLSEIQDISRAYFTLGDDDILRLEYTSPSGGVYVDFYHSNDTLRSGGIHGLLTFPVLALTDPRASTPCCVFESVDISSIELDTEAETQKVIEETSALLKLNINDFLSSLYKEYSSALGDLEKHYNSHGDYESLQYYMQMAESLMDGELVSIMHESSGTVVTPATQGYMCLSELTGANVAQFWYKLDAENDYFRLLNASNENYLYHSSEQLTEYSGLVDYGYYLKLISGKSLDTSGSELFKLATKDNLQPYLFRSETVDSVSVAFKNPDGIAFTNAGADDNRTVYFLVADESIVKAQADKLLKAIRNIRKNRLDSMDDTVQRIKELLSQIDSTDKSLYTETTWNSLMTVYDNAKLVCEKAELTTAEINLTVHDLEQAIATLKLYDDIILEGNEAYADATSEFTSLYTIFTSKSYVEPTSSRAKSALNAVLVAASNGTKGTQLITYGELDELCIEARYAYEYLVEKQHYSQLVSAVSAITNRTDTPVGYTIRLDESRFQPDTWASMNEAYNVANEILLAFDSGVWETVTSDVKNAAANLNSAVSGLVTKPDYTALSAVLSMLDSMKIDSSIFTEDSWTSYETVYRVSKELIGDEYAGQVAIDALTNELIVAANSLKIDGVDGEVSILPGLTVDINSDVTDNYDIGYEDGYSQGSSSQYVAGYTNGAVAAKNAYNKELASKTQELGEVVEEVTSIVNKSSSKNTILEDELEIYMPVWLIIVIVAAGIGIIAVGFFGGLIATKLIIRRKSKKAMLLSANETVETEE